MTTPPTAPVELPATTRSPARLIGMGMTLLLILFMGFAFVQALLNPTSLAQSFGWTAADGTSAYVQLYAIRALFLGVYALVLLVRRDLVALATFLFIAVLIPIGDTVLTVVKSGPLVAIIANFVTVLFVLATAFLLRRGERTRLVQP